MIDGNDHPDQLKRKLKRLTKPELFLVRSVITLLLIRHYVRTMSEVSRLIILQAFFSMLIHTMLPRLDHPLYFPAVFGAGLAMAYTLLLTRVILKNTRDFRRENTAMRGG